MNIKKNHTLYVAIYAESGHELFLFFVVDSVGVRTDLVSFLYIIIIIIQ